SEILLAPPDSLAATALDQPVPGECTHYRAAVGGRTYDYTVKTEPAPRLGQAARELNVHAAGAGTVGTSGAGTVDVWTVIYRANGYVGAITLVGAAATRKDLESIARRAYDQAQRSLQ
ncbi:MAG TPA: hypothetical protein VKD26_12230, partial [Streptosporangiaceae bacterium]|nr:hypothetical protein [Streptosporangiaceae bacterium]